MHNVRFCENIALKVVSNSVKKREKNVYLKKKKKNPALNKKQFASAHFSKKCVVIFKFNRKISEV